VFKANPGYKATMYLRSIAGITVAFWLAVNLLGCLTADAADLRIVSSPIVSTLLDIPDDLEHPSAFFPLSARTVVSHMTDRSASLLNDLFLYRSIENPQLHRAQDVLRL
jgi:hypothetical protein